MRNKQLSFTFDWINPFWRSGLAGLILILISIINSTAQRTIVTIGDSNGASKHGWVNQLKSTRTQDSIFNYSISGNTIGFDNLSNERLNTLKNIEFYLNDASDRSANGTIEDVVILLGTNDCKKVYEDRADEVIQSFEQLIQIIQEQKVIKSSKSEIYIVTPPPFGADSILLEKYRGGDDRVRLLLPDFMALALEYNCHFIDIYHELKPKFQELNTDGVHLNTKGSRIIAASISRYLDKTTKIEWDDESQKPWPDVIKEVGIRSPLDGKIQRAYFCPTSKSDPQPLIVSLHTWSGDYTQKDPLIDQILEKDWNYIHPDFRGANNTPKACGSKYAINDIEQAIDFSIKEGNVDLQNIHVIGTSGGGYATLYTYMNSKHDIATFSAWVPISDLEAWYFQSLGRKSKYAGHILEATGSVDSVLNIEDAKRRSPLFMDTPTARRKGSKLRIFAGIHDGYTGSIPVSQSLNFYNKVIRDYGASDDLVINDAEILDLVSMRTSPVLPGEKIGGRQIVFERAFKNISITLFEGSHEMLTEVALELLKIN